uniref:Uncharacterized protein n=2 Tax=Parascaris univalens TaxID=6257 RepID=A0A915BII7_PARUN
MERRSHELGYEKKHSRDVMKAEERNVLTSARSVLRGLRTSSSALSYRVIPTSDLIPVLVDHMEQRRIDRQYSMGRRRLALPQRHCSRKLRIFRRFSEQIEDYRQDR